MLWRARHLPFVLCITLALVAWGQSAQADDPRGQPRDVFSATGPNRLDAYGDPLPPGAVARMGSLRFYQGYDIGNVVLSPDGKLVVAVSREGAVRLLDATTGQELPFPKELRKAIPFMAGKLVAVERQDDGLQLWDMAAGKKMVRFTPPSSAFSISSDGSTFVMLTPEGLRFCDVLSGKVEAPLALSRQHGIKQLVFSGDGKTLVLVSDDHAILVWDTISRTERLASAANEADFGGVLAISHDGKVLATAPYKGKRIRLWDTRTLKELPPFEGQPNQVVVSLVFSPDGKTLAACYPSPTVRLWDVAARKESRQLLGKDSEVHRTAFSADGKTLAGADGRSVTLWDVASGKRHHDFGQTYQIWSPVFSPNGKMLATGGAYTDLVIRLWDPLTGKQTGQLLGHTSGIERLAFSPNGKTLGSGSQDQTARLWDVASGKELHRLAAKDGMVYALAFSPDGSIVATGGLHKAARLWDVATGQELRAFDNPSGTLVIQLRWSSDGKILASLTHKEGVRLWDANTGKEIRQVGGPREMFSSFAIAPDGKMLASSGYDGAVRLWDIHNGRELRLLHPLPNVNGGRALWAYGVAFAPDGRSLAAVYSDASARLWEVVSGKERARFQGHREAALGIAFSSDGSLLVSGSADRTAMVWDVTGERTSSASGIPRKAKELEDAWNDLAGDDAHKAFAAFQVFLSAGPPMVVFMSERLRPVAKIDSGFVDRMVANLDSRQFAERARADQELQKLGESAESALLMALAGQPSEELRRRALALLARLEHLPERRRDLRAVEILEYSGTTEARQLLQNLALGAPEARLTREGKASAERLGKRSLP